MAEIGDFKTLGIGNFIIAFTENNPSDGLVLSYRGLIDFRGQEIGTVKLKNGNWFIKDEKDELNVISFPSLLPKDMSVGLDTDSNIKSLSDIKVGNKLEKCDSIFVINWAIEDVKFQIKSWAKNKDKFYKMALNALQGMKAKLLGSESGIGSFTEGERLLSSILNDRRSLCNLVNEKC